MSGEIACYWEKQGADRLCAVHCVNTLMQGPLFSEVDLGRHAAELDRQERLLLQGSLMNKESQNVDATGNFSIGVIESALKTQGYRCLNTNSPEVAASIRANPGAEAGYICNSHAREHWFTIRKVKGKWWDLDSLKHSPTFIGEIYLSEFLNSTRSQGFTIFVVRDTAAEGQGLGGSAGALPEPSPSKWVGKMKYNQHFLTAPRIEELKKAGLDKEKREQDDAQRMGGGDGDAGPSFTVIAPADKRKQETNWGALGAGQSLAGPRAASSSTGGPGSPAMDDGDDELQAVLRASALEAAQARERSGAAVAVPEEPAAGPGVTTIQVRLSSGKRLQRRFLVGEHTVAQLLAWVERSAVEDKSLGLPVVMEAYTLIKRVVPGGQLKIERAGSSALVGGAESGGKTLKEVGFETGGEALTLQV